MVAISDKLEDFINEQSSKPKPHPATQQQSSAPVKHTMGPPAMGGERVAPSPAPPGMQGVSMPPPPPTGGKKRQGLFR